jgi:hypothetical protein
MAAALDTSNAQMDTMENPVIELLRYHRSGCDLRSPLSARLARRDFSDDFVLATSLIKPLPVPDILATYRQLAASRGLADGLAISPYPEVYLLFENQRCEFMWLPCSLIAALPRQRVIAVA